MAPTTDVRSRRPKKAERRALEGASKAPKLTQEEQDELEEKELEEWCEKWCGRVIRMVTLGSMLMGLLNPLYEWALRPPVLLHPVDLSGRTYVITGATDGIGAAAARRLAHDGAHVIIGARNLTRGLAAATALRDQTGNSAIEAHYLDLANLSSVVEFAASVSHPSAALDDDDSESNTGITALLNNAGSLEGACTPTMDGFEMATQVNFLAPALLTHLLLPQLEYSPHARVVHVSCPAAQKVKLTLEHLQPLKSLPGDDAAPQCDIFQRYANAKLMTLGFSTQLSRRLSERDGVGVSVFPVTSNAFDPVSADTAFGAREPSAAARQRMSFLPQMLIRRALSWLLSPLWKRLGRAFKRSAETAGHGLVHVAASPHLARVSGALYSLQGTTGLTRESGCTLAQVEKCGQAATPATQPEDLGALWGATEAALAPWLNDVATEQGSRKSSSIPRGSENQPTGLDWPVDEDL